MASYREGHTESVSMGCTPKQAAKMNEHLKKHGITGAYYDMKTGNLHMESPKARKQCVKLSPYAQDEGAW